MREHDMNDVPSDHVTAPYKLSLLLLLLLLHSTGNTQFNPDPNPNANSLFRNHFQSLALHYVTVTPCLRPLSDSTAMRPTTISRTLVASGLRRSSQNPAITAVRAMTSYKADQM